MAAVIGQGIQGQVVANVNDTHVFKITSQSTAKKEEEAAKILATIDPEQKYTLYGTNFEPMNSKKVRITMNHGGTDLDQFMSIEYMLRMETPRCSLKDDKVEKYTKVAQLFQPHILNIIKSFDNLLKWIPTMHNQKMAHQDLQPSNLLWDGQNLHMIDWGYATFDASDKEKKDDIEALKEIKNEFVEHSTYILRKLGLMNGGGKRKTVKKHKQKTRKTKKQKKFDLNKN